MKLSEHMEIAFDAASLAASNGCLDPVRRRGRVIGAYGWTHTFPTKREAKHAARKLRQAGYGRHRNCRSADRDGRFYMSRARRRQRQQQTALQDRIWEISGPPF